MGLRLRKEDSVCSLWWKLLEERLEAFLMGKSQAGEVSELLNIWGHPFHTHVVYVRAITYTCFSGGKMETREFMAPWHFQTEAQVLFEAPRMSVCLKMMMAQRQGQW